VGRVLGSSSLLRVDVATELLDFVFILFLTFPSRTPLSEPQRHTRGIALLKRFRCKLLIRHRRVFLDCGNKTHQNGKLKKAAPTWVVGAFLSLHCCDYAYSQSR